MSSGDKIPQPFINLIGTLYRFIAGAFGQDLPSPLENRNFCPYFWAVFFGIFPIPIGLPVILLGWGIRLTLGKGRGRAIMNGIGDGVTYPLRSLFGRKLTIISSIVAFGLVVWIFWEVGFLLTLVIIIGIEVGILIALFALFVVGSMIWDTYPTLIATLGKMTWTVLWPVRKPIRLIFYFFYIPYLATKLFYKKSCPIVSFQ